MSSNVKPNSDSALQIKPLVCCNIAQYPWAQKLPNIPLESTPHKIHNPIGIGEIRTLSHKEQHLYRTPYHCSRILDWSPHLSYLDKCTQKRQQSKLTIASHLRRERVHRIFLPYSVTFKASRNPSSFNLPGRKSFVLRIISIKLPLSRHIIHCISRHPDPAIVLTMFHWARLLVDFLSWLLQILGLKLNIYSQKCRKDAPAGELCSNFKIE